LHYAWTILILHLQCYYYPISARGNCSWRTRAVCSGQYLPSGAVYYCHQHNSRWSRRGGLHQGTL